MNPDIQNTGQAVKQHFYEAKRQQLGKPYSPASRQNKPETWYAAGEQCAYLEADPYIFVKAAFLYNNVPGGPFPNQMAGSASARWYKHFCHTQNATGKTGLQIMEAEVQSTMAHTLRVALSHAYKRPTEVLLDPYGPRQDVVPAFARVLLYPKNEAIRAMWERLACEELNSSPQFLAAVKRLGYDVSFLDKYV